MRINRNARRSARPVFRSVNSSRRRAKMYGNYLNSSRRRNSRRALNSARSLEIYSFSELNEAQKDYVVKNVMNTFLGDSIWDFFNDTMMKQYRYDVARLAREYESKIQEELGFEFNIMENRLYWQSNSQGPYPEWNLGDVFGDAVLLEGDIWFDGKGLDVDKAVYTSDASEDPQAQEDLNRTADYLAETLQGFINEVWSLVNEVCQAYPDDDYIYEDLEANDFGDFMVISETEAKPVRV